MRVLVLAAVLAVSLSGSASAVAEDLFAGQDLAVSKSGQPFCIDRGELSEYLQATFKGDRQWLAQLKSCGMLSENAKVVGVEDYPSDSELGHVLKIRIFAKEQSTIAYTITLGLSAKK